MRGAVVALALVGCAPVRHETPDACVTPCGLVAPPLACDELARVEHDITLAFDRYVDLWTAQEVCSYFQGWRVEIHPPEVACHGIGWRLPMTPLCIMGYTHEGERRVEVLDSDWMRGALAHELVHVVDIGKYHQVGHCRWKERGVKAALRSVTGSEDNTMPEADCDDSK